MGICNTKLDDGSLCTKETVWNDMCDDCLHEYEEQMYNYRPNNSQYGIITYLKGDATRPIGNGPKIIVHCCNDIGAWGAGFVLALSNRFPGVHKTSDGKIYGSPEHDYRRWAKNKEIQYPIGLIPGPKIPFKLGQIQLTCVQQGENGHDFNNHIWVCNLIGQSGCGPYRGIPPIRYEAIREGLYRLNEWVLYRHLRNVSIHMPRMGCGLAGGEWSKIEQIINEVFGDTDINVYVYDFG